MLRFSFSYIYPLYTSSSIFQQNITILSHSQDLFSVCILQNTHEAEEIFLQDLKNFPDDKNQMWRKKKKRWVRIGIYKYSI